MHHYAVFGGCLRSEIPFPELVATDDIRVDWTFRIGDVAPIDPEVVLHAAQHSATCRVRLTRTAGRYRYEHSCTGIFDVSADGREITWAAAPGAPADTVRMDVLARVLLLSVSVRDVLCLHGSGVICDAGAIAFLGHPGAGKSTLALALARGGARHLSDDTLPIELRGAPAVWSGDHTVRLNDDSARRLAPDADAHWRTTDGKRVLSRDEALRGAERAPLAALYLVEPVAPRAGGSVERARLTGAVAVASLIPHVRTAPILRGDGTTTMLEQVSTIVDRVPVYALRVPRDWAQLDSVVESLLAWHGGACVAAGASR